MKIVKTQSRAILTNEIRVNTSGKVYIFESSISGYASDRSNCQDDIPVSRIVKCKLDSLAVDRLWLNALTNAGLTDHWAVLRPTSVVSAHRSASNQRERGSSRTAALLRFDLPCRHSSNAQGTKFATILTSNTAPSDHKPAGSLLPPLFLSISWRRR